MTIREGRLQFEKRIRLVDGILNLGFLKLGVYTAKILVPYLPTRDIRTKQFLLTITTTIFPNLDNRIQFNPILLPASLFCANHANFQLLDLDVHKISWLE